MAHDQEVWFLWRRDGFWPRFTTVHWKGHVLSIASFAAIALLAFVSERHFPYLALYWIGMFVFAVIWWMLTLDHTKIVRDPAQK